MFTEDNFYNSGVSYDYDALNEILNDYLNGNDDPELIKSYSDRINNDLIERAGAIYCGNVKVGIIVNDE